MAGSDQSPENMLAVLNNRSQDIFRKLVERYPPTPVSAPVRLTRSGAHA